MSSYNQLLAKIDRIEVLASSALCSVHSANWRARLNEIQNVIQSKDDPSFSTEVHPDDIAIDKFAEAMKLKMAESRSRGRGGWEKKDECLMRTLQEMLAHHVHKGDPVDVGNFAMMLFNRGERTAINDASELRPMLEILQRCGMSVSRAMEIIELWQVGNYSTDDLPVEEPTDEKTLQVRLRQRAAPDAASGSVYALLIEAANRIADHEESDNDQRRLVRELDTIINGPGAAKQASLCDIVKQMHKEAFHTQSTDMARRLLQIANDPMWANHAEVDKTTLKAAAHEIDRFYHGMLAWKRTASEKDFSNRTPFQARVQPWMLACFGKEISGDKVERNHRFFEEATELVQACGMTKDEALMLIEYTFNREIGERDQEVGGVMVTLAALCLAQEDLDMQAAAETELIRIWVRCQRFAPNKPPNRSHHLYRSNHG